LDLSSVRIKEHFGIVTNDTNTAKFTFLISPPKNRESIQKQDIICLDHPIYGDTCQILGEVTEITSYEEVAGSTIRDRIGKLLAATRIIGYIDLRGENKPLQKLLIPPNPGSRVYLPYSAFLQDVLNRGTDGRPYVQPLFLGKTEIAAATQETNDQQLSYYLNSNLLNKHTLICGVDGAGKTHTATVILEELAGKITQPIVVFDPNNEYATLGTASKALETIPVAADLQKNSPEVAAKKIKPNQVTIINAESLLMSQKNDYYSNVLKALTKGKQEKTSQTFLVIVEDADNLATQALQEVLACKEVGAILISSHPTLLGGKILSQIQTVIIGKTVDQQDLAYLNNMTGGVEEELPLLNLGEWVIAGLNIARPTKIQIRERYSARAT
jgi:DNA helicase HerA-like ATPase